jgi:hypothetical protein
LEVDAAFVRLVGLSAAWAIELDGGGNVIVFPAH